jgi:hypothetical protein
MTAPVDAWWSMLCALAVFNALAWSISAFNLRRQRTGMAREAYAARRLQLQLSAVYVFGCAFRSLFPVFDIPRLCLVNSWISSVIVGRSVATCAELCFAAQWAAMLREASRAVDSPLGRFASRAIVPLIAVAEVCSWYSVLTTSNIGHIAEESIWGLSAMLLMASMLVIWPRCATPRRSLLATWSIAAAAYATYMLLVDVPMYWRRWIADQSIGRHYLSVSQGIHDAAVRWLVSYRWDQWKSEVVWMSLYFSVAVWLSIALVHAPMFRALGSAARRVRVPAFAQPTPSG